MSQVRPLLSPLLVGRDDLLALAERRIAEAAAGHGQLLLLAGEAGIGKTRLLGAILRKARATGFRLAKGDLAPQDRDVPLSSILDLARTMRAEGDLGSLGDELLEIQGGKGGDTLGSRRVLVHDIADRIAAAVDGPLLLAFEDLQWADEMSLEVIGELARRATSRPLLVLATYRLDEFPAASLHREWRARLLAQRLGEEVRLARLDREQTALVTTLILGTGLPAPREVADAVHQRTNGIPLHVEELLAALPGDGPRDSRAIRDAVVPDTIEDAVLARVGRLSPEAQAVARAGAVMGRCFPPAVLAGVMDRPPGDLDAPLQELVQNAVLYPFDFLDTGFYDFRHQLLRDALYGTVPPADLRRFHARAGEFGALIEGATEIHASIHFERAGLRPQAYRSALAGARAASAISGRKEAFDLYARAAANVPDDLPALELAELYAAYAEAAFAIDSVQVAEETSRLARRYYLEAGRPAEAADQLVSLASMARRDLRPPEERRALLEQAEAELLVLPDSPERAAALAGVREIQGMLALDVANLGLAAALFTESHQLAEAGGIADDIDLEYYLASVDILAGRCDEGLTEILRVAREGRDANLESTGVTAYRVAAAYAARVMDYRTAEVGVAEGLRYADAVEQSYCRHVMAATRAHLAWAAGRWDDAVRIAEIELVESGSRRGALGSRHALGYVAFSRGDVGLARLHLDESLAVGRASGELEMTLPAMWGLAETALVAAEPQVAAEWCERALDMVEPTDERSLVLPFVVTGVRAYLADRRPDAAERWLARMTELLDGWRPRATTALDHADGLVRLSEGALVMARSALERAVAGWDELGRTWEASWARLDLAASLVRANRHADALPVLREVQASAEALGSRPLLERARELSSLARSRGAEEEPWRPLTAREFEIARLVADGLTNVAIADALGLSPRTVGAHVEHILAKLGATRRAEIAVWATTIRTPQAPVASPAVPSVQGSAMGVGAGRR